MAADDGLVDGEGGDTGGDVAAVAVPVHLGVGDGHLGKGVVHIGAGHGAGANDGQLAGQGVGAGQAVDLTLVGRTEDAEDDLVTLGTGRWQIVLLQENALAGSGAHDHARDSELIHDDYLLYGFSLRCRPRRERSRRGNGTLTSAFLR